MEKVDNILQDIENIQKDLLQISYGNENLLSIYQWWFDLQVKYIQIGIYRYVYLFFGFPLLFGLLYLLSLIILSIDNPIQDPTTNTIYKQCIEGFFSFLGAILSLYWIYLPYKIFTYHKNNNDTQKMKSLQTHIHSIHSTPQHIYTLNENLINYLNTQNTGSILTSSQKILETIETISSEQKKIYRYFNAKYIQKIEKIILAEINLLQKIIAYNFQQHIQNHQKIITHITNIQNTSKNDYKNILELQKSRIQKQKEIFESLLNRKGTKINK